MVIRDDKLRADRLIFYEKDVQTLDGELDGFLELSGARSAFLIDREGHLVTRRGEPTDCSDDSLSALVAGAFAATKEMARLLGEAQFANMFHQGTKDSIQMQLVGDRTLLVILFDQRTNLGMVRFYAQETAKRLEDVFKEMATREPSPDDGLSADFSQDAAAALDDLF